MCETQETIGEGLGCAVDDTAVHDETLNLVGQGGASRWMRSRSRSSTDVDSGNVDELRREVTHRA